MNWIRDHFFHVFVLKIDRLNPPFHKWENWEHILPVVDKILQITDSKITIRSSQSMEGRKGWLPFGGMRWGPESNLRWTTKYAEVPGTRFFDTEVWAPPPAKADGEAIPIDIYIKLERQEDVETPYQALIVAVRDDLFAPNQDWLTQCVMALSERHFDGFLVHLERRWGAPLGDRGFRNGISDSTAVAIMSGPRRVST